MVKKINGLDPSGKLDPVGVRDAMITCFRNAHKAILKSVAEVSDGMSDDEIELLKDLNIKFMIKSQFDKIGGSFDCPTKDQLLKVCDFLKEYAANFRDKHVIDKHYNEIMALVEALE